MPDLGVLLRPLSLCRHSCRSVLPLIIDGRSLTQVLAESVAKRELWHARERESEKRDTEQKDTGRERRERLSVCEIYSRVRNNRDGKRGESAETRDISTCWRNPRESASKRLKNHRKSRFTQ